MKKIIFFCLTTLSAIQIFAMDNDTHQKNKAVNILKKCKSILVVREKRTSYGDQLVINCDCKFVYDYFVFLKELLRFEGYVTKDGVKKEPITSNPYTKKMFLIFFQKLTQDQKNNLFDYALSKTSYDMLCFMVTLGAQIDAPWAQYKKPYSQYLPVAYKVHGSRIRSSL